MPTSNGSSTTGNLQTLQSGVLVVELKPPNIEFPGENRRRWCAPSAGITPSCRSSRRKTELCFAASVLPIHARRPAKCVGIGNDCDKLEQLRQ